jgi:hypothetical protein
MAAIAGFEEALSTVLDQMLCSRDALHSLTPLEKCWERSFAVWGYNTRLKAMMTLKISYSSSIICSVIIMYPSFAAEVHMSIVVPTRRLRQKVSEILFSQRFLLAIHVNDTAAQRFPRWDIILLKDRSIH